MKFPIKQSTRDVFGTPEPKRKLYRLNNGMVLSEASWATYKKIIKQEHPDKDPNDWIAEVFEVDPNDKGDRGP